MSNPFDYVNQILQGKKNLIVDEITEKEYNPFLVNRSLSMNYDTVLLANEMNQRPNLDLDLQYDFLRLAVTKKKRYSKWVKKETATEDILAVSKYYNYSLSNAEKALELLTEDQLIEIKAKLFTGGLQ